MAERQAGMDVAVVGDCAALGGVIAWCPRFAAPVWPLTWDHGRAMIYGRPATSAGMTATYDAFLRAVEVAALRVAIDNVEGVVKRHST